MDAADAVGCGDQARMQPEPRENGEALGHSQASVSRRDHLTANSGRPYTQIALKNRSAEAESMVTTSLGLVLAACGLALAASAASSDVEVGHIMMTVTRGEHREQLRAPAFQTDDGAGAAWRFCVATGVHDVASIKNVARDMQNMLDNNKHEAPASLKLRTR